MQIMFGRMASGLVSLIKERPAQTKADKKN